jgi:hypothetical protein
MKSGNPVVAVFDTKPYDRDYLGRSAGSGELELRFHEFRLGPDTAFAANGALVVCVFVNDVVNRDVLIVGPKLFISRGRKRFFWLSSVSGPGL